MKINAIKEKLEKLNTKKIQLERDRENILKEWEKNGIVSIKEAENKKQKLTEELKKLKIREQKLIKKLEDDYDWESLEC